MGKQHNYSLKITWTGNTGEGTSNYRGYKRNHTIRSEGKALIEASSDPSFLGDKTKYNPEELLVASLSSCHMLWYLHLCSEAGVVVTDYTDDAVGIMIEEKDGSGRFESVTLNPVVTIRNGSVKDKAIELHARANSMCFIANSVNFSVNHNPVCIISTDS